MITTPKQIDQWRAVVSEHAKLEFKEAKNQFDNQKLYEYCVALANEGGGHILLGIADKPPRPVVGTKAFNNPVGMEEKLFENLGFRVRLEEVEHPDGRVLVIHVPSRPRGTAYHLDGRYLMRAGQELVPMTEDRLREIFAEGGPDWSLWIAKVGCTEDEVVQLLMTQRYFDLLEMVYPATRDAVLDRFAREHLIERSDGLWNITNLGAILFAKRLSDFEGLARKAPRFIVYEGVGKTNTKRDQLGTMGYAVGFQRLVTFVNALIPANEVIENALRREVKMFPEIAIRELVANALIHQDFNERGGSVMIELYDDRIEISNPGRPFISPDRFIDEYQSRNERLADLMRRLRICEEKGSGVDKVVQAAETYQLPAPDFRVGERRTSVVLFAHKDFEDMDRNDRIRATYQHCCLRYVMNQKMSNQSLRERFKLPEAKKESVSRAIRDSVEAGKIKVADPEQTSFRYRHYLPFWA